MQPNGVYVYRGQWYNDLKHGVGEERYPTEESGTFITVRGLWYHNLLNGVGLMKDADTGSFKEVIYKDNM